MTAQSASAPYVHIPQKPKQGHSPRPAFTVLGGVARFFRDLGRANEATHLYQKLSQMSDAELARRGLARADVPTYVFEQTFGELKAE